MLTAQEFQALCERNDLKIVESCSRGVKVWESEAGKIIKVFRGKNKFFTSNNYKSYASRFANHADRLNKLKVLAPKVDSLQFCRELNIHVLSYDKLPGQSAASLAQKGDEKILQEVMKFVAKLHQQGIYFRALHLSNLLLQENKDFALIDVADMHFKNGPLSLYMRCRNLKHLFRHRLDKKIWAADGLKNWIQFYCQMANFSGLQNWLFNFWAKILKVAG